MEVDDMINVLRTTAIGLGIAGTLAVTAATPSLARVAAADRYDQRTYAGPYGGYAYAPGFRGWDYRASDDIDGPYSACYPSLRWQNRC
jgi:hypothetical protein